MSMAVPGWIMLTNGLVNSSLPAMNRAELVDSRQRLKQLHDGHKSAANKLSFLFMQKN
jgi:hypothetical protein